MSEWLKEHAWKACVGETLPRVRIPLSPPNLALARFGASSGLQAGARLAPRLGSNPSNSKLRFARFAERDVVRPARGPRTPKLSPTMSEGGSPRLGSNPS